VEIVATEQEIKTLLADKQHLIEDIEVDTVLIADPEIPNVDEGEIPNAEGALSEGSKESVPWGLGRIGATTPKDGKTGKGVHVYVFDTGVRITHREFDGGRARATLESFGKIFRECADGDSSCADDGQGRGTHCAGTVGGKNFGVAPESTIHAVKTLNDNENGTLGGLVAACDWVARWAEHPAVVSISLVARGKYRAFESALRSLHDTGITVVTAAGNSWADSCKFTPAFVASAITVGSSTYSYHKSWWSNWGSCIDIWAPGSHILSSGHRWDWQKKYMSGTSMASAHVSGAAALLLEDSSLDPDGVLERLVAQAHKNVLKGLKKTDKNLLLWVGEGDPTLAPTPKRGPWWCWSCWCVRRKCNQMCPKCW